MLDMLSGILTLTRLVHPENATPPIFVTPSGIVMSARALHPVNA